MSNKKSSNTAWKKKSDVTTSISVVVLGDENVGKSSLISTFISRHFSEEVPGIMTRVRLPPDPSTPYPVGKGGKRKGAGCITTIVDTQEGDKSLLISNSSTSSEESLHGSQNMKSSYMSSKRGLPGVSVENIDSIVLVYDLDRNETFHRLENHWLPLIEQCSNGEIPVIIAGNKMDLQLSNVTDEQSQARSRHQIVSLLQKFKFVRQCIKCSAKTLLNVNDVFVKAQHAVLYPINPLYDLTEGKLTSECKNAFTRIFRIFDQDNDGLLSNKELNDFQSYCFKVSLMEGDLAGWKKVLSKNNPAEAVVRDGKFTVFGFHAIFDVFISSDRLEIPWIILRIFGYGNDLKLEVPPSVANNILTWKLSSSALEFLTSIFHQFASKSDGFLGPKDILSIFSIVPSPSLPPWHPSRVQQFSQGSFSTPKTHLQSSSTVARKPNVSGNDKKSTQTPPEDPYISKMSLSDWIGHWHMLSSIAPSSTRVELYRLGFVADSFVRNKRSKSHSLSSGGTFSAAIPRRVVRAVVIGSKSSGKTAFLNCLCKHDGSNRKVDSMQTVPTLSPETSCMHVYYVDKNSTPNKNFVTELVFTEVPSFEIGTDMESELSSLISNAQSDAQEGFDLVILLFNSKEKSSLSYAIEIEKRVLTDDTPRVYVGSRYEASENKAHQDSQVIPDEKDDGNETIKYTMEESSQHCEDSELERPIFVSATPSALGGTDVSADKQRLKILNHFLRCACDTSDPNRLKSRPFAEKKRREAEKRKKTLWLGGLVSVSVVAVMGVRLYLSRKQEGGGKIGFLRNLFLFGGVASASKSHTSDQ